MSEITGVVIDESDEVEAALKRVLDGTPEIPEAPTAPTSEAMSPDDARVALYTTLAAKLEADAAAAEKDLEKRFNAPDFTPTPESNNLAVATLAAIELATLLRERVKAIQKPRILRPERSLKIVRPR